MNIKNFTFFKNYKDVIEQLKNDEEKAKFLYTIYQFMFFDIEPQFEENSLLKMGWLGIKSSLETSKNRGSHNVKTNEIQKENKKNTKKIQTSSISTSTSISNNKLEDKIVKRRNIKEKDEIILERFNEFWKTYPRHEKKAECQKWYLKNRPDKELHNAIVLAIKFHGISKEWEEQEGKFIPYPTTYLNQKRWEDFKND